MSDDGPTASQMRMISTAMDIPAPAPSIVTGSDERAREATYRARRSVNEGYANNKADLTNTDLRMVLERLDAALAASRPIEAGAGLRDLERMPLAALHTLQHAGTPAAKPKLGGSIVQWAADEIAALRAALATPKPPVDEAMRLEIERLQDTLERLIMLTPNRANASNAQDLHCSVRAIAEAALAKSERYNERPNLRNTDPDRNLTGDGAGA